VTDDFQTSDVSRWDFVDAGDQQGPSAWGAGAGLLMQKSGIADSGPDPVRGRGTVAVLRGSASNDVRLVVRIRSQQPGASGVVFGYRDAANFYRFSIDAGVNRLRLVRCAGGTTTLLWDDTAAAFDLTHEVVLTADVVDDCVTVWLDGRRACQWRHAGEIDGALGLYCSKNPGVSFAGFRAGAPEWVEYYTFGPELPISAGNRVKIAPAASTPVPDRRTSLRIAAEFGDTGFDRLPPNGARLRLIAPDGTVQHARDVIPASDFVPLPFQALRKADGTGIFITAAANAVPGSTLRLLFEYHRDDGVVAFTEVGDTGNELVFIDLPSA
jgi:hypothetical protein